MNISGMATTDEVAEILGIKKESVYIYVRRLKGFPQPTKVGRTLLFNEAAVRQWRTDHPSRQRGAASGGNT
jgi:excisionase family DNA binding protein